MIAIFFTTFDHEENNTGRHPEAVAFRSSNMFGKALPREGVDIVAPPSEPKNIIDDVKEVADRARKAIDVVKDRTESVALLLTKRKKRRMLLKRLFLVNEE